MRDMIEAGTILMEDSALVPDSLLPRGGRFPGGWISFDRKDRPQLEAGIQQARCTLFYLAGRTRVTACGFDEPRTLRQAVERVTRKVKAQGWNCLEFTQVSVGSFLGVQLAAVIAHARHIQRGSVLLPPARLPNTDATPVAARSRIRPHPSETKLDCSSAEAEVAAWEDEGGAAEQPGGCLAR